MSAAVILVVGLSVLFAGGIWFEIMVAFVAGLAIWELARICAPSLPNVAVALGVLSAAIFSFQQDSIGMLRIELLLIVPIGGTLIICRMPLLFLLFSLAIGFATFALADFRNAYGVIWIFWVILVIIASDTLGYIFGKMLGGPKFWPRISPKKTWSGTIAGWVGAAIVGTVFYLLGYAQPIAILVSVLIAFAGQMGDITVSALKRRAGIKDSSDLIPGHGGILDRFDAMLGVFLGLGLLGLLNGEILAF